MYQGDGRGGENSSSFENYFGDEINLGPQYSSYLFPFARMPGPNLPELQTSLPGYPTHTSKSIQSLKELISFPIKLNFFLYPRPQVMAAPSTQCQNFLLSQISSGHKVLLYLSSQFSPPVLFSLFPLSCSRPHLLPL